MELSIQKSGKRTKRELPDGREHCPDMSQNGDAETLVRERQEFEEKVRLYPLRIDSRTVVYVRKEKLTEEYAEKIRERLGVNPNRGKPGKPSGRSPVDLDRLREMLAGGMSRRDIATEFGVSRTTVCKYVKLYNLSEDGNGKGNEGNGKGNAVQNQAYSLGI